MHAANRTTVIALAFLAAISAYAATSAYAADADWSQVDDALGAKGSMQAGDVWKYGFARSDLEVKLDGVTLEPGFALGSWAAFKQMGDGTAMVMGDLVLLEDEVGPVMQRLARGGIDITAVHNHLLRARPFPMYMHIEGHGDPVALAKTLKEALQASKTPLQGGSAKPASSSGGTLDTQALDRAMGRKGSAKGAVYSFSFARAEEVKAGGMTVPPSMGTGIGINFQPAGDGKAATTGDFVLRPEEVNTVLRTLLQNGIEVEALHSHMLEEEPRLFFMHFWGHDDAEKLARGLKAALDEIDIQRQ
jgi:hypothetical protein